MTLQLLHFEFPYILGKFDLFFISDSVPYKYDFTYTSLWYSLFCTSTLLNFPKVISVSQKFYFWALGNFTPSLDLSIL